MECPLCGNGLTDVDRSSVDERYRCTPCYPNSKEAQHGWLTSQRTRVQQARKVTTIAGMTRVGDVSPWFACDSAGNAISRERKCECGATFTQRLLSERFLGIVHKQGTGAMRAMERDVRDGFVPVHCPPCERRDLGMAARRAKYAEAAD